eukprot:6190644-Pleurochrysis_carterae.AAC.3
MSEQATTLASAHECRNQFAEADVLWNMESARAFTLARTKMNFHVAVGVDVLHRRESFSTHRGQQLRPERI